jgi:uncharacterized protein (DUF58 family)
MLLIDVSKSSFIGTQNQLKNEIIAEIAGVLAFSAIQNNDKVGVLFFSDAIEMYIPPKKRKISYSSYHSRNHKLRTKEQ